MLASPAWWGFANSSDKQRLEAFMRRCVRLNFLSPRRFNRRSACCRSGWRLVLFAAVLSNDQHVLRCILPERNTHSYSLRPIGAMNLYWQPSVTLETFLKDNYCLKICIDILFSCVLSTVFQRLKWSYQSINQSINHRINHLHKEWPVVYNRKSN